MTLRASSLVVAIVLSAELALADPLPRSMRLEYSRAAGAERCPDEQSFRYVAESQMSYPPFSPDASARLVVTLQRKGRRYQGSMELRGSDDALLLEREMDAFANCRELVDSLALAAAVHLDPIPLPKPAKTPAPAEHEPAAPAPPAPAPRASVKPPAPAKPEAPVKLSASIEPTHTRLIRFAGAGIAAGFGVAPTTAFGLTLNGGALVVPVLRFRGAGVPASAGPFGRRHADGEHRSVYRSARPLRPLGSVLRLRAC